MAAVKKGSQKELIVITGVSYGIGYAMTKWFQSNGHQVIGCSRSADKIEQLNKDFCSATKHKQFFVVDITSDPDVRNWAEKVVSTFGSPTFLLNNAGLVNRSASLWEVPVEEFDKVIDVNIKGTTNVLRHFIPAMIESKRGVIVNFTSGWGRSVSPDVAPYCATKWGLEGLSKALAMELPAPLTCVPLNPGIIDTPMLQTTFGPSRASLCQSPEQWAEKACPYILSIDYSHNGKSVTAS
ncbi:NADPH-dependent pterin aldehyde reductase-like [Actinia tenebrosa]|uniref:NADPH-dependent pterin aldehyde reductase-like n=1 Tax=Actinia tenebrosa TaxID=6105 RepID=A0A6P8IZJ7_ACTTE|nr:NADPH-dependent pterin aldehyde reductase-like [Actinia tenebrosa]